MALVQKQNPKRTLILTTALIAVVAGGVITLLILQRPSQTSVQVPTRSFRGSDLPIYSTFGEELYTTEQFRALHDYLEGTPPIPDANVNASQRNPNPFRAQ
ncbi:MAG: hypothetical protein HY421_00295 [Candidatus Kerfeldbacteria bacterium]|nr:hypothetical protein [Candidatus Kerfeldbacteria bacterium]